MYIKVIVKEDPYYKRNGYDIYTEIPITISTAVLGGKIQIKTLQGIKTINVSPGTVDGTLKNIGHYGLAKSFGTRGSHIVKYKIDIPKRLSRKMRQIYVDLSKREKEDSPEYKH